MSDNAPDSQIPGSSRQQCPRRAYKQRPIWIPESQFPVATKLAEPPVVCKGGDDVSVVDGLLQIVSMINVNPELKNDLEEYFQNRKHDERDLENTDKKGKRKPHNTRRQKKKDSARQVHDVPKDGEGLEALMNDYHALLDKQKSEEAEEENIQKKNEETVGDLDGEELPTNLPNVPGLQGFKKTFVIVDGQTDSYKELPMELDSDDESPISHPPRDPTKNNEDNQQFPHPLQLQPPNSFPVGHIPPFHVPEEHWQYHVPTQVYPCIHDRPHRPFIPQHIPNIPPFGRRMPPPHWPSRRGPPPGPPRRPPHYHSLPFNGPHDMNHYQPPQFAAPPFDAPPFDAPPFDAPPFDAPPFDATPHISPPTWGPFQGFHPRPVMDSFLNGSRQDFIPFAAEPPPPPPPLPPSPPQQTEPPPAPPIIDLTVDTPSPPEESGDVTKETSTSSLSNSGSYSEDSYAEEDSISSEDKEPDELNNIIQPSPAADDTTKDSESGSESPDVSQVITIATQDQDVSTKEAPSDDIASDESELQVVEEEPEPVEPVKSPVVSQDEDADKLRLQLLSSIRSRKSGASPSPTTSPDIKQHGPEMLTIKNIPEVIDVDSGNTSSALSSNEGTRTPLARCSKRKMIARPFTIERAYKEIERLPHISEELFQKYHATKRSRKKARQRARQLKIHPLQLLKEELHYDMEDKEWYIQSLMSSQIPRNTFSWSRLYKHMPHNYKPSKSKQNTLQEVQASRRKRLEKFYKLSESVQNGEESETPVSLPITHIIVPNDIKITITKDTPIFEEPSDDSADKNILKQEPVDQETSETAPENKFISTFKEKNDSPPKSEPIIIPQTLTRTVALKEKQSVLNSPSVTAQKPGESGHNPFASVQNPFSSQKPADSTTKQEPGEIGSDPKESVDKPPDEISLQDKSAVTVQALKKDIRDRKVSEDDLDGMREMLLQSMIKRNRDGKENIVVEKKKSNLPTVEIKTKRSPYTSAVQSPCSSPPRKQRITTVHESLMPRKLNTLTPDAIQRSNDVTRRIISQYLVDEDLRLPVKDTFVDPETQKQKEKHLKLITPVVKPLIISTTTDSDNESTADSDTVTTPVKSKNLFQADDGTDTALTDEIKRRKVDITMQIAQLERRLVQYTVRKNQHVLEHNKHIQKVKDLEGQLGRARSILDKSSLILKTLDDRQKACITDLKDAANTVADLNIRMETPALWMLSNRKQPVDEIIAAPSTDTDTCGAKAVWTELSITPEPTPEGDPGSNSHNGTLPDEQPPVTDEASEKSCDLFAGLEPGEVVSEESVQSDSEDSESSISDDIRASIDSAEGLLAHCQTLLELAPPTFSIIFNERAHPPFQTSTPLISVDHVTSKPYSGKYVSPLTVFRSYRFSPYFRSKTQYSLHSSTFSHNIQPNVELCSHDLHGKCVDRSCSRQHISTAIKITGAQLRTQLCLSAGMRLSELKTFEVSHKGLGDSQMSLLFCNHLNSLRKERKREYYFVNTQYTPPEYHTYKTKSTTHFNERIQAYDGKTDNTCPIKFKRISTRYYGVSELSLSQQCKQYPRIAQHWLDLAACQLNRGAGHSVASATLSKALQFNRHSPELWAEYLNVKASLISPSDLTSIYQQAIKLAPSPTLWRKLAPNLHTFPEQLNAINSALHICDLSKPKDKECYGELRKDRLYLVFNAGYSTTQEFGVVFKDMGKLEEADIVWFVQQYLHFLDTGGLTDTPHSVTCTTHADAALEVVTAAVTVVTQCGNLLVLHRLQANLLAAKAGPEAAINYLSKVTERSPELYELMEEIITHGGWVEPDIAWPRLCYLQMEAAVESGDSEHAKMLARDMITVLSRSTSDHTLQLYRELLGLTIGATVNEDLVCFTRDLHRTWLWMCFGFLCSLYDTDSVLEYRLYSTRLATVSPVSAQLNALRYGISTETMTRGVQILWIRYLDVMQSKLEQDPTLVNVLQSELVHCLKTVPTTGPGEYSFHNQVLTKLISHIHSEERQVREITKFLDLYSDNRQLLVWYDELVSRITPLSVIQQLGDYLTTRPGHPHIWTKLLVASQRCQAEQETRLVAKRALAALPLNSQLLLQVLLFELRSTTDDTLRKDLCNWAFKRALDRGINLHRS